MNEELTNVQLKTLNEIQTFIAKQGYPPTVGELADRLKRTKAAIHGTLDKLIRKGFLRRTPGKARSLEVVQTTTTSVIDCVRVPLLGEVPAGSPVSAEESQNGYVFMQADVIGGQKCFGLAVCGDSMRDADILPGDVVIVRKQPLAEHGDIVVASCSSTTDRHSQA